MNANLKAIGLILSGMAVGSSITYFLVKEHFKNYYDQIEKEDIASVKEIWSRRKGIAEENKEKKEQVHAMVTDLEKKKGASVIDYRNKIKNYGYSDSEAKEQKAIKEAEVGYHVIKPEEYNEPDFSEEGEDDYERLSFTYYSDGVLADENDDPVEDVEEKVGPDFASHFGEYEPDSVYIKNDDLGVYYEILRDNRTYAEVTGRTKE